MEYTINTYKYQRGKIFTTTDNHKYIKYKVKENKAYMKCVLFRNGCKATAKLNLNTNLITPMINHNHTTSQYKSESYSLKSKCKSIAKSSQENFRKTFDDVTREDPAACEITFKECESSMHRSRRISQPIIPNTATEFSEMLPTTPFGRFHKSTVVSINNETAVIFFSDTMNDFLTRITDIQFDGTFFVVPIQFYQLWTLFVTIDNHILPAIHCLMTGKEEQLYVAVLEKICSLVPQFQPRVCMSDWEAAPRNALRQIYPNVKINGCWFHFTQRI